MASPQLAKLAKLIVGYSVQVRPGDLVAITARTPAMPLIEALFRSILEAGGHPYWLPRAYPPYFPDLGRADEGFIRWASEEQLGHVDLFYQKVIEEFDGLISIQSESNLRTYANLDPARVGQFMRSHSQVQARYFERFAAGSLKRVLTQYPTEAAAQEASMSLLEYEEFLFHSMFLESEDPAADWRQLSQEQERLAQWLAGRDRLEIKGENVELALSVRGRRFLSAAGEANLPDGEIFTGPVEDSVDGWVRFTYPDYGTGSEIAGIELEFAKGEVIKARAERNEDKLLERLRTDDGARRLGELGIGTNPRVDRFTRNVLLDEKMGGTVHLALGGGYPDTGSTNESAIHWDMLLDMNQSTIHVDGELFYEDGEFKV